MRNDRDARFEAALAQRFNADAAQGVDLTMALAVDDDEPRRLTAFEIRDGKLTFQPQSEAPDVTFFFDRPQTALDILDGQEAMFAAFADSRFRADGNLPLAFVLLGLFGAQGRLASEPLRQAKSD